MTISVVHIGGNVVSLGSVTSDSWTSTSGSTIILIGSQYGTHTLANGDMTDSKSNTYTFLFGSNPASSLGIGVWVNLSGTRGASHTVTSNTGAGTDNLAVLEVTSSGLTYDTTTKATATDATSPFTVTAAAAVTGTQIAVYGVVLDTGDNFAWTPPSGYTDIQNQPDGVRLVTEMAYKNGETGTPSPAASSAHSVAAGKEIFVSFSEAGGAAVAYDPASQIIGQRAAIQRACQW